MLNLNKVAEPVVEKNKRRWGLQNYFLETWSAHFVWLKTCSVISHGIHFKVIHCFISELETKINYESLWNYNLNTLPQIFAATVLRLALKELFGYFINYAQWFNWHLINNIEFKSWNDERKLQTWPLAYLNVNMSVSPPCVHTFMYIFKVTCSGRNFNVLFCSFD